MARIPGSTLCITMLAIVLTACGGDSRESGADHRGSAASILQNGHFEAQDIEPWYTAVHARAHAFEIGLDTEHAHKGAQSVRIHSLGIEPWGGVLQLSDNPAEGDSRWRLSAWLRGQGITEAPELMVVFRGQRFLNPIQHRVDTLSGDFDWQAVDLEFDAPDGSARIEIGVIHHGEGTLWVDDVSLLRIDE